MVPEWNTDPVSKLRMPVGRRDMQPYRAAELRLLRSADGKNYGAAGAEILNSFGQEGSGIRLRIWVGNPQRRSGNFSGSRQAHDGWNVFGPDGAKQ
jgi:hypothetical protein